MTPSTSLSTSPSPLIGLIRAQVLLEAQRLCLEALASPMRRGLAAIGSKTLRDVWRGAVAGCITFTIISIMMNFHKYSINIHR